MAAVRFPANREIYRENPGNRGLDERHSGPFAPSFFPVRLATCAMPRVIAGAETEQGNKSAKQGSKFKDAAPFQAFGHLVLARPAADRLFCVASPKANPCDTQARYLARVIVPWRTGACENCMA
jgi:hypothetical protein